jgi:hypothetical protein
LTYWLEAWKNNGEREECARNILKRILKKIHWQIEEGESWKNYKKTRRVCACARVYVCVREYVCTSLCACLRVCVRVRVFDLET